MKVTVSCGGKFHAFHLAEQLDKRGYLHKLITPYYSQKRGRLPELRTDKEQIDPAKVVTNIVPLLISRGFNKVTGIRQRANWDYYAAQVFDGWARKQIDRCDLLVAWSGFALHTLRAVKPYGAVTVVERGSSHISFQKEIVEEEYQKYGVKTIPVDDRIVEKELSEYREADYISIPSEFVKQTFIKHGVKPEKLIHVPYGVDLSHFNPIPKEDRIFRVIFVGGLTLQKGVHYLLEAYSQLKLKNSELLLIGSVSPEVKPFLRKYHDSCRYIGKVPHLELYKYYSQGSIFVLPSIQEGMAMVIAQAMACGLPVICTTNSGGADIIREKSEGYIVPIRDVNALKEKILYLYDHEEERRSMSEMSLKRAHEFTWNDYGDRIIAAYREAIKRSHQTTKVQKGTTPNDHYLLYWDRQSGSRPSHSFNEDLFQRHFRGLLSEEDWVLDVGCGAAENYQARVKSMVRSLSCIDLSSVAVEQARKQGFDASQHDFGNKFKFSDNTYDRAICLEVLEHLFDPLYCVREIYRVLKPGGKLVASVPNSGYFRWRLGMLFRLDLPFSGSDFANPWRADHIRFFDQKSFARLFEVAGFEIETIKSNGDTSIYDFLSILGAPGRFLAGLIRNWVTPLLRLAFLGDLFPGLFAPHLIVTVRKQVKIKEVM